MRFYIIIMLLFLFYIDANHDRPKRHCKYRDLTFCAHTSILISGVRPIPRGMGLTPETTSIFDLYLLNNDQFINQSIPATSTDLTVKVSTFIN